VQWKVTYFVKACDGVIFMGYADNNLFTFCLFWYLFAVDLLDESTSHTVSANFLSSV